MHRNYTSHVFVTCYLERKLDVRGTGGFRENLVFTTNTFWNTVKMHITGFCYRLPCHAFQTIGSIWRHSNHSLISGIKAFIAQDYFGYEASTLHVADMTEKSRRTNSEALRRSFYMMQILGTAAALVCSFLLNGTVSRDTRVAKRPILPKVIWILQSEWVYFFVRLKKFQFC